MKRLICALLLVVACEPVTGPITPGAVEIPAPAGFADTWKRVELCSGLERDFAGMRWYTVPGALDFAYNGGAVWGLYQHPNRITIAEYAMFIEGIPAHEMLHALLATKRIKGHPAEYRAKCAGVVASWED